MVLCLQNGTHLINIIDSITSVVFLLSGVENNLNSNFANKITYKANVRRLAYQINEKITQYFRFYTEMQ